MITVTANIPTSFVDLHDEISSPGKDCMLANNNPNLCPSNYQVA